MNKLTLMAAAATAVGGMLAGIPAAHAGHERWEYAKVVRAEPVVRHVRVASPRQECWEEPVTERTVRGGHPNPGAVLIGGIIGGVIGHQFGKGHGQDVATAAGAVIGAHAAARNHYQDRHVVERTVYETTCRTHRDVRTVERIDAYDVTYKYHGRLYHTRLPYDPGHRIRVRVDVSPAVWRGDHLD